MRSTVGGRHQGTTGDRRSQATVLGAVLVIGLVITATAVVVTLGADALSDTQSTSELERAENSMTLFNTRTSMVALGNSPSQSVEFGRDSGRLESLPDAGWLKVTHANYTAGGDDEVMFNETLGAVVYTNDDTKIAYQGGGVWRKQDEGVGLMISPPEFHYRGATLTLPIVRVNNSAGGAAGSTATIRRATQTRRVFPNATSYNVTGDPYENPVANGTVNVTVQTEYYHGWAEYFRERTEGAVTEFPSKNQVRVSLQTIAGNVGDFEMPKVGQSIAIRGIGSEHPINTYNITLAPDNSNNKFNNLDWSMYADNGNEQFELHFGTQSASPECDGGNFTGDLDVSLYYYNTSGSDTIHEEWQNQTVDVSETDDFNCQSGALVINITSDTKLEMGDISGATGSGTKWHYGTEISSRSVDNETKSFTFHDNGTVDMGDYSTGDKEELGFLVSHYFGLLGPQFDLTVGSGPGASNPVNEDGSEGTLLFDQATGTQFITFLHITENEVYVTFD
ncbi:MULTISPECIES: DUF7289 family protein [Salinibaculum]|uniref:DUF7289 family protein n=1 Tax=Salinibaculum TaxID=2732368 RepID=UPI0030D17C2D